MFAVKAMCLIVFDFCHYGEKPCESLWVLSQGFKGGGVLPVS